MKEATNNSKSDAMMHSRATLRRLVIVEMVLSFLVIAVSFFQAPLLPPLLQQFEREGFDRFDIAEIVFLCLGIPLLILYVVAWAALLLGWRTGRMLYTMTWVAAIPALLLAGPSAQSALLATVDTAASLVGGMILGFLYFSDIRHFYKGTGPLDFTLQRTGRDVPSSRLD